VSSVIAACVAHGLDTLRANPHVIAMLELRDQLHSHSTLDAEEAEELANFLRTFQLALPDATTMGAKRANITLPQYTKIELSEMSGELGVSMSNLIVLCCCITLCDQPIVLEERRQEMAEGVEKFYRRLRIRREATSGWLRGLGG
jgi:hypothetical protein